MIVIYRQLGPNEKRVTIPSGRLAEVMDACWCCALSGETCTPGDKSGLGRALLVQCFK